MDGSGVTWTAVGMAVVSNVTVWLKIVYDNRKNNGKNGRINGSVYKYINENTTRSKLNEQKIENISSNMEKMDERNEKDHEKISNKLDKIIGKL